MEGVNMTTRRITLIVFLGVWLVAAAGAGETKILVNHIGYDPGGAKQAVIQGGPQGSWSAVKIIDAGTGKAVFSETAISVGPDQKLKN